MKKTASRKTNAAAKPTDSVALSRRLLEGKTAEEIFQRGKEIWKAKRATWAPINPVYS